MKHHQITIVGGGTGGLSIASLLLKKNPDLDIAIIDPAEKHYYQPIWTLVGAGVFSKEFSARDEADYIPFGTTWIKEFVSKFDPENNQLTLQNGDVISYDYLVVAAGIQLDWDKVDGLKEALADPESGVGSNYHYDTVDLTWKNIRSLKKGTALFTHPSGPIKCGGAPQKITYLASHYWQKQGLLNQIDVKFVKAASKIFGIEKYRRTLSAVADRYGIERVWMHDLKSIRKDAKEAIFINKTTEEETVMKYDMIHVTPYQSSPDFIKNSPLANEGGFVEVDKHTTQHVTYKNVFSVGDCSSLPTGKTGAAIRKQAPVTVNNILSMMHGKELVASYDGYSSCPLVTGYGSLVLAEFDYNSNPTESFPFDQSQERYSMYALKAYALPQLYWNGMLKGREF